jgi:hypothetical protein
MRKLGWCHVCTGNVRNGSTPASQLDLSNGSYSTLLSPERTFCKREEFRAPAGVRKSPRNEPAGGKEGLWGFRFLAGPGAGARVGGARIGGHRQAASSRHQARAWERMAVRGNRQGADRR